jgi:hypothetical protein
MQLRNEHRRECLRKRELVEAKRTPLWVSGKPDQRIGEACHAGDVDAWFKEREHREREREEGKAARRREVEERLAAEGPDDVLAKRPTRRVRTGRRYSRGSPASQFVRAPSRSLCSCVFARDQRISCSPRAAEL